MTPSPEDLTQLLEDWQRGDQQALEALMPLVYERLRHLARRCMAAERTDHTLQTTALLHEAYLRLAAGGAPRCHHRDHFYAVAARLMRQLLVDHARAHRAAKRGGGGEKVPLGTLEIATSGAVERLVLLDEALERLAALDPRKSRTVELRWFAGLTIDETAEVLGVSPATVVLDTRFARAWLSRSLGAGGDGGA